MMYLAMRFILGLSVLKALTTHSTLRMYMWMYMWMFKFVAGSCYTCFTFVIKLKGQQLQGRMRMQNDINTP